MARGAVTAEAARRTPAARAAGGPGDAGRHPLLPLVSRNLGLVAGGRTLLADLSFWIGSAERTVVLGPNGAGKSVLLGLCHGLAQPTSGVLRWGEHDVVSARRQRAMVLQQPVLLRRSVAANLDHVLKVRGVARSERGRRVTEALAAAGLSALSNRPARRLSGGEQKRLAIARALVVNPSVLLLDEPTANLDPGAVRDVERLICIAGENGTKVVMTTHDIAQARRLADDVMFLHEGRLLEHSSAPEFFHAPKHELAARFVAGELLS